ncbi:MAG TPA: tetratricopeptide repeat-containing diguanylate cyclase [Gemmatimonadaceae bacterium]|nr:tetratricopeptide repeat-containing diguanylate cyclase [Gemmatimonadaceae bacterium]
MTRRIAVPFLWFLSLVALAMPAVAQTPTSELEGRLPGLVGIERVRALTRLVDAHKIDDPDQALRYGAEALKLFEATPDPVAHASVLNEMGWSQMTLGRYDSATAYLERAQRFAGASGDKMGSARALSNLGSLAQRVGDPRRAVNLFEQALSIQRTIGIDRETSNSLNNLGFVYSTDLADYTKALTYHLEAFAIRERLGDKSATALSLNNIGIVFDRLRSYDRALSYFDRALAMRRELGNKARIASTLDNMGDTYLSKGEISKALSAQREALALRAGLDDRSAIGLSHRNLGMVYLAMHRADSAKIEMLEALRLSDQVGDKGLAVRARLGLAAIERATGTPDEGENYAREALAIAEGMGARDLIRQASEEVAASKEVEGELVGALTALKRAKAVSDSIFNVETAPHIASLEQKFADERHMREVDSLRHYQAALELQSSQRVRERDSFAAIAFLMAIIAALLYRRRLERTRLAEELSVTDALTGVWNRRYVQQTIQMDVAASLRRHRMAALRGLAADDPDLLFLVVDIDHFKHINDEFGHGIGDQVLIQLGTVLRTTCRDSDVAVRWGGEEFLVIARFTDRAQAAGTAERLRVAIERHATVLPDGRAIRVTCSVGFAAFPFDVEHIDALGWEGTLAMADVALYDAKRAGRNAWTGFVRVAGAGAPITAPPVQLADADRMIQQGLIACESSRRSDGEPSPTDATLYAE